MAHDGVGIFLTLTFAWHSLPGGELAAKAAMQGFIKRLRRWIDYYATQEDLAGLRITPAMRAGLDPGQFRFLGAVERGSRGRLHCHLNLFGLSPAMTFGGFTVRKLIKKSWQGRGFVQVKPFRPGAARYVAKYLLKSPAGRIHSKGSRGVGALGALAIPDLAAGHNPDAEDVDRRVTLPGGRFLFLDPYLADRLRRAVGFTSERIAALRLARVRASLDRCRTYVADRWRGLSSMLGPIGPPPDPFRSAVSAELLTIMRVFNTRVSVT